MDTSTAMAVTVGNATLSEPLWACTFWGNLLMYWMDVVMMLTKGLSKLDAMSVSAKKNQKTKKHKKQTAASTPCEVLMQRAKRGSRRQPQIVVDSALAGFRQVSHHVFKERRLETET